MEGMKMKTTEAWKKVDDQRENPELANTPGYEMEALRESVTPVYWFLLMMEQPLFRKEIDWSRVEKKPSLYWDALLRKQPQFVCHCDLKQLGECQIWRIHRSGLQSNKAPYNSSHIHSGRKRLSEAGKPSGQ